MNKYMNNPMGIENESFHIITKELQDYGHYDFSEKQMMVVKRVIHTTADFDYANLLSFNNHAIEKGMTAVKKGCKIYCDTNMIKAGVSKVKLAQFGCELVCYVADDEVKKIAKSKKVTRSYAAVEKAFYESNCSIYMIGNAPTALFRLQELIEKTGYVPALIIGVPVGFVGAAKSKETLLNKQYSSIVIKGRKGGSTVAVSIINALMYLLNNERE